MDAIFANCISSHLIICNIIYRNHLNTFLRKYISKEYIYSCYSSLY